MRTFKAARVCKVKARQQGNRTLIPPGFRTDHAYQVLQGFMPSISSELHFVVVNEVGESVVIPASDLTLLDPFDPAYADGQAKIHSGDVGVCKIRPMKTHTGYEARPGFRLDRVYTILDSFVPPQSSDLHFIVVNEQGSACVMPHTDILVLDPKDPNFPIAAGAPVTTFGSGGGGGPLTGLGYTHNQPVASATWTIDHPLGFIPGGIHIVDSAGTVVMGEIQYITASRVVISFTAPFSGKAYLS